MFNQKKERRAFLIALLIAIIIHLGILFLLFLKREFNTSKETPFNKEQPAPQKAPVKFTKSSYAKAPEDRESEKKPNLPTPQLPPSAQLIPGSHSKENIVDGRDDGTTTDRSKAKKIEPARIEKKEEIKPVRAEPVEAYERESEKNTQEILEQTEKVAEKPSTEGLSQADAQKFSKQISKIKKRRSQELPQILDRRNADAPVLKNAIEGFSKWMNDEGNNPYLERNGSKDGKIDFEEAKLLSYFNKLIDFFHNASEPFSDQVQKLILRYLEKHKDEGRISGFYRLIIGPKGELEDIRVINESGLKEYDRMIVEQFKRAAPFPPIPKHLNKDKVVFPITIYTPFAGNYPYMKFY